MKQTDELKQQIKAKRAEVEKLQQEMNLDLAAAAADELNDMVAKYKVAAALEEADFKSFMANARPLEATSTLDTATLRNRAFNKLVFGRGNLTDEERAAYFNVTNTTGNPGSPGQIESVDTRGGYLVPEEQMRTLQEFRKDFVALKDYVSVVSTNTTSGRWATYTQQDLEFQNFAELTDIAETDVTFSEATYVIADRGLIMPISNQLIADADVDIMSFIGRQLAEGAVYTENKEILKPLNTLITGDTAASIAAATTITSYKALQTAMMKTLDGVYASAMKIFTNQDGLLWLANLEDGQNRPLFQPDVTAPNTYRFRGKEIVVVPNLTLPNTTISSKDYAPIFIGDMRSYLTFFERQGLELATSSELYFRKYGTAIRAIIRFGVVVTDPNAMVALKVEV